MADRIHQWLTPTREVFRYFNHVYDGGHRVRIRGYLGAPLNLCRNWTWSRCVQAMKSMQGIPQVSGWLSQPRHGDGPNRVGQSAPPVLAWIPEVGGPQGLEATCLAESSRGGLKRGGDHPVIPPHPSLASLPPLRPPPTPSLLLWPRFPHPPHRGFARPVSFQRIEYVFITTELGRVREVPWDGLSFWECESLPATPTEVSPRTGGDETVVGQEQLWALRRHCEIVEPDVRSGPDYYSNTSRASTA